MVRVAESAEATTAQSDDQANPVAVIESYKNAAVSGPSVSSRNIRSVLRTVDIQIQADIDTSVIVGSVALVSVIADDWLE